MPSLSWLESHPNSSDSESSSKVWEGYVRPRHCHVDTFHGFLSPSEDKSQTSHSLTCSCHHPRVSHSPTHSLQPHQHPCAARTFQVHSHLRADSTGCAPPLPQTVTRLLPHLAGVLDTLLMSASLPTQLKMTATPRDNAHPCSVPPQSIYTAICQPAYSNHLLLPVSSMRKRIFGSCSLLYPQH